MPFVSAQETNQNKEKIKNKCDHIFEFYFKLFFSPSHWLIKSKWNDLIPTNNRFCLYGVWRVQPYDVCFIMLMQNNNNNNNNQVKVIEINSWCSLSNVHSNAYYYKTYCYNSEHNSKTKSSRRANHFFSFRS